VRRGKAVHSHIDDMEDLYCMQKIFLASDESEFVNGSVLSTNVKVPQKRAWGRLLPISRLVVINRATDDKRVYWD
jgi:hypothetical protein